MNRRSLVNIAILCLSLAGCGGEPVVKIQNRADITALNERQSRVWYAAENLISRLISAISYTRMQN